MKRFLLSLFLSVGGAAAHADIIFNLDTMPLESSAAGPFTLDFQFIDGDGTGDANNTVTLSNFLFGGGSLNTTPALSTGGVNVTTGPFGVSMTDSSFFNEVQFALTPGSALSFHFTSTTNNDPTAPDTFTFAIFDGSGNEIATTNPNGFDSFIEVDLPSGRSGVTTTLSGSAAGASVMLSAPTSGSGGGGTSTPEPAGWASVGLAAGIGAFFRRRVAKS